MPSSQHEAIVQLLKAQQGSAVDAFSEPGLSRIRSGFAEMTARLPIPPDLRSQAIQAGGVPAEWIEAPGCRHDRVLLYLHGGGYVLGSVETHRELIGRIARACATRALAVDYRLAPEHPFPAAFDDCVTAYRWLVGSGIDPARVAIAGDSAGGGLALATLLALRRAGDPLPAAGVCLSPWTDLAITGASVHSPETDDPFLPVDGLAQMRSLYLAGADPRDPRAAPLYGDYAGLPPLLIQVGTRELLLDDSTRVAERARAAGVDVTLEREEGLIHVWHLFGDGLPESREAVARIGRFVDAHLA